MADKVVPVGAIKGMEKNRRPHGARNREMIRTSLERFGAARSIVVDENDTLIAGHGVTSQAEAAGITTVRIVDVQPGEMIAVRKSGLSDRDKRSLAIADNRTNELSDWDVPGLAEDESEGLLDPWFDADERKDLVAQSVVAPIETVEADRPPPTLLWVLVAVDIDKYHLIAEHVAAIEAMGEVSVQLSKDHDKPEN